MRIGPSEFLIIVLVSTVVGALVGLAIGAAKGRPVLGVVLGLLLGWIGWIILACLSTRSDTVTREQKPSRGWYPDPTGAHERRFFDGNQWMADVADKGVMSTDPIQVVPAQIVRVGAGAGAPPPPPPPPPPPG